MGLKIVPSEISTQNSSIASEISRQNENMIGLIAAMTSYGEDTELAGVSWSENKEFFQRVHTALLQNFIRANEILINLHISFCNCTGTEYLSEQELEEEIATYKNLIDECSQTIGEYLNYILWAKKGTNLSGIYSELSNTVGEWNTNNIYLRAAEEKLRELWKINANTADHFSEAQELQDKILKVISELAGAWVTNPNGIGGYFQTSFMEEGWYKKFAAEVQYAEALRQGLLSIDDNGRVIYHWDRIEQLLQGAVDELTEIQYSALIQVYENMERTKDLEKFFARGYCIVDTSETGKVNTVQLDLVTLGANDTLFVLTPVFLELVKRYKAKVDGQLYTFYENGGRVSKEYTLSNRLNKSGLLQNIQLYGGVLNRSTNEVTERSVIGKERLCDWLMPVVFEIPEINTAAYKIKINVDHLYGGERDGQTSLTVYQMTYDNWQGIDNHIDIQIETYLDSLKRTGADVGEDMLLDFCCSIAGDMGGFLSFGFTEGSNEKWIGRHLDASNLRDTAECVQMNGTYSFAVETNQTYICNMYIDEGRLQKEMESAEDFKYDNKIITAQDIIKSIEKQDWVLLDKFNDWYKENLVYDENGMREGI